MIFLHDTKTWSYEMNTFAEIIHHKTSTCFKKLLERIFGALLEKSELTMKQLENAKKNMSSNQVKMSLSITSKC